MTAGALPFVSGVQTAEAVFYRQSASYDLTFIAPDNSMVTCTADGSSSISRSGDSGPFQGLASTNASPRAVPGKCDAFVAVTVTYRNSSGTEVTASADGENVLDWYNNDIGSNLSVVHHVSFLNCDARRSICDVEFRTAPK